MLAAAALVALVLGAPGLWGVGNRLEPVAIPEEWKAARDAVGRAPGPVLALPYHRYLDLPVAGNRRALHPLPDYLGGDVLSSSDPELGTRHLEVADPREPAVLAVLAGGNDVAGGLARAGVRWVAILHAADWEAYRPMTAAPGLRVAVSGPSLDLVEVEPWQGSVVTRSGRALRIRPVAAPLQRLAPSGPAVWSRPAAGGWRRGFRATGRTTEGLTTLPGGRGLVWFWPSVVVLVVDGAAAAAVLVAGHSLWRRHPAHASQRRRRPD
jgi:hypothetical protein